MKIHLIPWDCAASEAYELWQGREWETSLKCDLADSTATMEQSRLNQPPFFFFLFMEARKPGNGTSAHLFEQKHKIYSLLSLTSRLFGVLKSPPGKGPALNNSSSLQLVSKEKKNNKNKQNKKAPPILSVIPGIEIFRAGFSRLSSRH